MLLKADKNKIRQNSFLGTRQHLAGTAERPRLTVFQDSRRIYTQLIDDENGVTLSAASFDKNFIRRPADIFASAKLVGAAIANTALANGITEVVFDNGCQFDNGGRFAKHLAEYVREVGLKF